ncbi:tRNA methyl transferase PRC-barrel domain-containing protein, partial [Bacillus velezensis]|uniref:tRNA methyl transferase PRC-barrel domain-containing protein n=1 Tax=Bacillus velezensis TaxID=492670 RepID=UPI00374E85D8
MMTMEGEVKGRDEGVMYYSIGEGEGVGIGGRGERWLAVGKDVEKKIVYVDEGLDNGVVYWDKMRGRNVRWRGWGVM